MVIVLEEFVSNFFHEVYNTSDVIVIELKPLEQRLQCHMSHGAEYIDHHILPILENKILFLKVLCQMKQSWNLVFNAEFFENYVEYIWLQDSSAGDMERELSEQHNQI